MYKEQYYRTDIGLKYLLIMVLNNEKLKLVLLVI